jgi:hypothetical protein
MGDPWGQTLNKNNELNATLVLNFNTFVKKMLNKKNIFNSFLL